MEKLNISPIYQTLYCCGEEWSNNDATIDELGVTPNTIIDLLVFEEDADKAFDLWEEGTLSYEFRQILLLFNLYMISLCLDPARVNQAEDGFKGTGLLTNGSLIHSSDVEDTNNVPSLHQRDILSRDITMMYADEADLETSGMAIDPLIDWRK